MYGCLILLVLPDPDTSVSWAGVVSFNNYTVQFVDHLY